MKQTLIGVGHFLYFVYYNECGVIFYYTIKSLKKLIGTTYYNRVMSHYIYHAWPFAPLPKAWKITIWISIADGSAILPRPAMLTELATLAEVVTPLILSMASKAVGIAASKQTITWACLILIRKVSLPVVHSLSTSNPPPTENLIRSGNPPHLPRIGETSTPVPRKPVKLNIHFRINFKDKRLLNVILCYI